MIHGELSLWHFTALTWCLDLVDHIMLLQKIAQRNGLEKLSIGMSADFEVAIQFGATHVRVGTAVFGERINA